MRFCVGEYLLQFAWSCLFFSSGMCYRLGGRYIPLYPFASSVFPVARSQMLKVPSNHTL